MICEVELCVKPSTFNGLCIFHRKKAIGGGLEFDDDGTIWDTCAKGHRWTSTNTHWESNSKGGKRRRCRLCLALKSAKKREEPSVVLPPQPVRHKDAALTEAMRSFDAAQTETRTLCFGKFDQWTDYTRDNMPTPDQAAAMCEGCPFFMSCDNNAEAIKPGWGVWAGKVWVYGERWDGDMEKLHGDD
jgi:hypothetical protein